MAMFHTAATSRGNGNGVRNDRRTLSKQNAANNHLGTYVSEPTDYIKLPDCCSLFTFSLFSLTPVSGQMQ